MYWSNANSRYAISTEIICSLIILTVGWYLSHHMIRFIDRRHLEPVKSRRPWIVLLALTLVYFCAILETLLRDIVVAIQSNAMENELHLVVPWISTALIAYLSASALFVLRAFLLWVDVHIAKKSLEYADARNRDSAGRTLGKTAALKHIAADEKSEIQEKDFPNEHGDPKRDDDPHLTDDEQTMTIHDEDKEEEKSEKAEVPTKLSELPFFASVVVGGVIGNSEIPEPSRKAIQFPDSDVSVSQPFSPSAIENTPQIRKHSENNVQRYTTNIPQEPRKQRHSLNVIVDSVDKVRDNWRQRNSTTSVPKRKKKPSFDAKPVLEMKQFEGGAYFSDKRDLSQNLLPDSPVFKEKASILEEPVRGPSPILKQLSKAKINANQEAIDEGSKSEKPLLEAHVPELSKSASKSSKHKMEETVKPHPAQISRKQSAWDCCLGKSNRQSTTSQVSHTSLHLDKLKQDWIVNHRSWFQGENVWSFIVFILVIQIAIVYSLPLYHIILGDMTSALSVFKYFFCALAVSHFFCLLAILWKVRRVQENFGLVNELTRSNIAFITISFLKVLNAMLDFRMEDGFGIAFSFRAYNALHNSLPLVFIVNESLIKIYRATSSRANNPLLTSKEKVDVEWEFHLIMAEEEGQKLFADFLKKELSVENILFYLDVERYRNGELEKEELYETYIADSAPLCVNISAKNRKYLVSTLGAKADPKNATRSLKLAMIGTFSFKAKEPEAKVPEPPMPLLEGAEALTIFDDAFEEIRNLMIRDSFSRFRTTPEFKDFLANRLSTVTPEGRVSKFIRQTVHKVREVLSRSSESVHGSLHMSR
jgi:hypothetical protein